MDFSPHGYRGVVYFMGGGGLLRGGCSVLKFQEVATNQYILIS
jgi:hypothetical protein